MKRALAFLAAALPLLWMLEVRAGPRQAWVILDGDAGGDAMSGSTEDVEDARAQQRAGEALVFVRRGDAAWVLREPAQVARARAFFAPVRELGHKMDPFSKTMEALGARQSRLGEQMEPLGARMGELGTELGGLDPDDPRRDEVQADMEALSREMQALSRKMEAVSAEMRPVSQEMERLGRQITALSKAAEAKLGAFLDDAIARGAAQRVR